MAFKHFDHGIELPYLTRKTTNEGRRYFTPAGDAYPSVTTVLGILSKKINVLCLANCLQINI